MFSVGAILLEILTGFPLWLSLKGRVEANKYSMIAYGLFAVQGKAPSKILIKQKEVIKNLRKVLEKYNCFNKDPEVIDLLEKMLNIDPLLRISPHDALNHPYLKN